MTEPETEETPPEAPKFEWKETKGFPIVEQVKVVVEKTIDVLQLEVKTLRKKLEKLQYGG